MAPIPECIKADWGVGSRASLASLDIYCFGHILYEVSLMLIMCLQ